MHADGVYRFVLKNLKDDEDAKDIVQDAFVKLWDKAETIQAEKAKSYLFTAAYHTMIDHIRKHKRISPINYDNDGFMLSHQSQQPKAENFDLKAVLNGALDKLPEIQRTVIMLRDYEGYSYEEIGEITALNESQVKVYIYRGRMALKNYIGSMDMVL